MSNLLPFQARERLSNSRDAAAALLLDPQPHTHAVQFYETEPFLVRTVREFLTAGLDAGDRIVVIATKEHGDGFMSELDPKRVGGALAAGQLMLLDAKETLSKFMIGDMPDPDLFRDLMDRVFSKLQAGNDKVRVRAYGEMVDVLWRDGNSRAAIRLEELWNEAGEAHSFSLLCAYVMGNFYKEGDAAKFMEVCRTHSHVIPSEGFTDIDDPHARLREISFLQQRAHSLESEIRHRKDLETALRDALKERGRVEEELRDCVKREMQARARAEANDAFKEMFLGILGHDLRNPLNTVLTTARLMKVRAELPPDTVARLDRIVASGVRMERMIGQLLDVARARLAGGIPVTRTPRVDLSALATKMVDEMRAAHPNRQIDLGLESPCLASVDSDRIEQVISNLLGNALTHGDATKPVAVTVASRNGVASLIVHNFGNPIEPAILAALFDPFTRVNPSSRKPFDGLGLGLYIAERIVSAHGGKIEVESSSDEGTRFEVILPVEV
jgi:signal transduction histidine kinase